MFLWVGRAGVSGTREQKKSAVQLALSCTSWSIKEMPLPPAPRIDMLIVRTPAGTFSGALWGFHVVFSNPPCRCLGGVQQRGGMSRARQDNVLTRLEGRETRGSLRVVGFFSMICPTVLISALSGHVAVPFGLFPRVFFPWEGEWAGKKT